MTRLEEYLELESSGTRSSSPIQFGVEISERIETETYLEDSEDQLHQLFFSDPKNAFRIGAVLSRLAWHEMAKAEEIGKIPEEFVIHSIEKIIKNNVEMRSDSSYLSITRDTIEWDGVSICRLVDGIFCSVLAHARYINDGEYLSELLDLRRRICQGVAMSHFLKRI